MRPLRGCSLGLQFAAVCEDSWDNEVKLFVIEGNGSNSFRIRQLLLDPSDVVPRVMLETAQSFPEVQHGVLVTALGAAQFLPGYRHRNRSVFARAGGIGCDRSLLQ